MNYLFALTGMVLLAGLFVANGYFQARQRRIALERKRRLNRQTNENLPDVNSAQHRQYQ